MSANRLRISSGTGLSKLLGLLRFARILKPCSSECGAD